MMNDGVKVTRNPKSHTARIFADRYGFLLQTALADVDIRAGMQVTQQVDGCLFGFLLEDVLPHGIADTFLRCAGIAHFVQFDDMPAELGADGRADLSGFERVDGFFKGGNHHAVGKPAQISAVARARVLRILAHQAGKVCAAAGLSVDFADGAFRADGSVFAVGFNQDVLGAVLAQRCAFGQGDALFLRLLEEGIDFSFAHSAVLHHCLLADFFGNDVVGKIAALGGAEVFEG